MVCHLKQYKISIKNDFVIIAFLNYLFINIIIIIHFSKN